jgi:hypothetical protein
VNVLRPRNRGLHRVGIGKGVKVVTRKVREMISKKAHTVGKALALIASIAVSSVASAGGQTNSALITKIELIRGDGMVLFGAFGNPSSFNAACTSGDLIFVKKDHPDFKMIHTMATAAQLSGKRVYAYTHVCDYLTWYTGTTATYPRLTVDGVIAVLD